MAGRPQHKVEINLNSPDDSVDRIMNLCRNENISMKAKEFCGKLHSKLFPTEESSSQTDVTVNDESTQTEFTSESIVECLKQLNLTETDISFILQNMFIEIDATEEKMCNLYQFVQHLTLDEQVNFFFLLGTFFNENLFNESEKIRPDWSKVDLNDLEEVTKRNIYENADPRLSRTDVTLTEDFCDDDACCDARHCFT